MLSNHHILSQTPLRADSVVRRLESQIWQDQCALDVQATAFGPEQCSLAEAKKKPLKPVAPNTTWGRLFDQRWCRVRFPRTTKRGDWFSWQDLGEATLYVKGVPYFGFDPGHKHCLMPEGLREVWVEANCVSSAIWVEGWQRLDSHGSLFKGAFLERRNDDAWDVYHDMKCLLDAALTLRQTENPKLAPTVAPGQTQPAMESHSPAYRKLLRILEDAADIIEQKGLVAAHSFLTKQYKELRQDKTMITAILTGHAHIDLVWLWPERIGEIKAVHTFSTVHYLMHHYPEFRFAYSQPASYEAVRRREPKLYDVVQKRIATKKWQPTGAMYVESDTNIACGEALLRSFSLGQQGFREIRGSTTPLTWLPDVFGYSACLPQIMKLSGVKYFFTTKMTWNLVNRFPYSSFVWRGHDGSEVIAHVTQDCGYNASVLTEQLKAVSWGHQQVDVHNECLLPTGYGDGGGGPTAEMCERARRLDNIPGMPSLRWDHPEAFFERLAPLKNRLPVWKGECYLEGHRGTLTTHASVKDAFRALERALQISEAAGCVSGRTWDRTHAWKRLVFAQFHDYIPGSSVWDVYKEGVPELNALASQETARALQALSSTKGIDGFLNPHAIEVTRWITPPGKRKAVRVRLPALSATPVEQALTETGEPVSIKGRTVDNGMVSFNLDQQGWISKLAWNGRPSPLTGPGGQLIFYKDFPARYEAWDLDRHTLAHGEPCSAKAHITPLQEPHRAGFTVQRRVGEKSQSTLHCYIQAGDPLLYVDIELDWHEEMAMLKLLFPTRHMATHARFGVPFGSITRPQVTSGLASEAMWEVPFSRWLSVYDEGETDGFFAVSEAKYGATVRDGQIGISLVRSPHAVGFDGHGMAWLPELTRLKNLDRHTDQGHHVIRFAFGHYHQGLTRAEHPASLADTLFTAPLSYKGPARPSPLQAMEGGETLIPSWAEPLSSNAWLLRLHEASGRPGKAVFRAADDWTCATCDAEGKSTGAGTKNRTLSFGPYEIVSLRFERRNNRD
jgi:alpha-mannosidase